MSQPPRHDIVVVGASTGGLEAVSRLVAGLPPDLAAAVFVVQHVQPGFASMLPEILSQRGPLKAGHAIHGETIVPGRIYVAPPDNHLELRRGYLHVVRGPKENGHRPAVDALFRTASKAYGSRVIGVVLTGHLDCGTAGLLSIKARGGLAVVQDPADATSRDMPASAIKHVDVDHIVRLDDLPELITRLVDQPPTPWTGPVQRALAELEGDELGVAAAVVCPMCQGKLTETEVRGFELFRCHVGHAFSIASMAAEQAEELERALWESVRALEESAALAGRLGARASGELRRRFLEKEEAHGHQADMIRGVLLSGSGLSMVDADRIEASSLAGDGR